MALVFKTKGDGTCSSKFIIVSHQCCIVEEDKDVYFGVPLHLRDTIVF